MIKRFFFSLISLMILFIYACDSNEETFEITVIDSITQLEETYILNEGTKVGAYYGTYHEGYYLSGFIHNGEQYSIYERLEVYEDTTITILYDPYEYAIAYYERDDTEVIEYIAGEFDKLFLMTSTNRVLAYGSNKKGELGLSHDEYISTPFDITPQFDLAEDEIITDINVNGNAVFFKTSQHRYFILGETKYSNKKYMYQFPKDITTELGLELDETILEVSGTEDYYLLTSLGKVLKLTYIDTKLNVVDITESFQLESGDMIEHIYCDLTSFATSKYGEIFGWGLNNKGQVGDNHIDFSTVDFNTYDDFVSDQNIVKEPIKITSHFQLNQGEFIKDIQSRENISYFISSEERFFVTGHLFLDDAFYKDKGRNHQYTNIPVDVSDLFGLEEGEIVVDSFDMTNLVIYITNTNRKIAVGHVDYVIPNLNYTEEKFKDVTQYLPEHVEAAAIFKTITFLDNNNQLYALGRTYAEQFEFFKDISDVDNIVTVNCSSYSDDLCIEFTVPTNITDLYHLGYKRIYSEIIPYGKQLVIPETYIEMFELKKGSMYAEMPNKNLFFVID